MNSPTKPMATPTPPTTTPKRLRACLYARVSTRDKGQDPTNQLIPLREKAKASKWAVVAEVIELESASGRVRRAQFQQMLKDAEGGKYDLIAFWSLDRFSREGPTQTLVDLQRLHRAGVGWFSIQEPLFDTTNLGPFREVIISLIAAVAKMETDRRSERAKAAAERKRQAGEPMGRKSIHVDREALTNYRQRGFGLRSIAQVLGVSKATLVNRMKKWGIE